jgi:hypothetical protein
VLHLKRLARDWVGAETWNGRRGHAEETAGAHQGLTANRREAEDAGWYTRKRIAREYRLVKGFAGKRRNWQLDGGEGGVNGAAGNTKRRMSDALPKTEAQSVGRLKKLKSLSGAKTIPPATVGLLETGFVMAKKRR